MKWNYEMESRGEVTEDSILFCTEDGENFFHLKSRSGLLGGMLPVL